MKKIFFIIICFCLIIAQLDGQNLIPAWFENLPEAPAGTMLSVGFAGKYKDTTLARQVAINHALINMSKQKQIRLIFDLQELADGRLRLLAPTFEEFYEESILIEISSNFTVIDSANTDEGYFILLAYSAREKIAHLSSKIKTWGSNPDWIDELPTSKKWSYGIGIVGNYASWVRAWKEADEYARFDLCKNSQIAIESMHTQQKDDRYTIESVIFRQSYDTLLYDAVVVERWYDAEQDIYYSLCRTGR